ncbi:MAG: alpha/beta hydrolase [Actinomycetota bacterium]
MRTSTELLERCRADGEFVLAARHWNGALRLDFGGSVAAITLVDGEPVAGDPGPEADGALTLTGPSATWEQMLAPVPPPFANDIAPARALGLRRMGDELLYWQYAAAAQRAVELLRAPSASASPSAPPSGSAAPVGHRPTAAGTVDAPVGRYVHLELGGVDHRVYYEEAGQGIPLLCQHTAGAHGAQWRHLFEEPAITDRFRLIAYDLPYHGKSLPPVGPAWWATPYRLEGEFLRSIPLALIDALGLDQPVFMGCSVGGLLALDLAAHHPASFRSVISVEGALSVEGDWDNLLGLWHPQVSNEAKARMMEGLTAPCSPTAFRKETTAVYAAGWPPAFHGDLYYYLVDYDLTELADSIDTSRTGVHIMNGQYDYSATVEQGRAAHDAIAGSTFTEMADIGHFPMCENPDRFLSHLLPVLDRIEADR